MKQKKIADTPTTVGQVLPAKSPTKRQMTLSFARSVKPRVHHDTSILTETEQKERFWQKVIVWISNEISRANLRNLEEWAWECGYCAKSMSQEDERPHQKFLEARLHEIVAQQKQRTDLTVTTVKERATHIKQLMTEHTVAEKAQIKGSSQDVVLGSHASVLKSTQKTAFGHVYSSKKRLLEVLPALHSYFSA
jgi:hypothetical protein